jgi:hypothetical protein
MFTLLQEHRFVVPIGTETVMLRVEELVSGSPVWGGTFRLQIPPSAATEAKTLYGESKEEVARLGAEFLDRRRAAD